MRTEIALEEKGIPQDLQVLAGPDEHTYSLGHSHIIIRQEDSARQMYGETVILQQGPDGPRQFVVELRRVNAFDHQVSVPFVGNSKLIVQRFENR